MSVSVSVKRSVLLVSDVYSFPAVGVCWYVKFGVVLGWLVGWLVWGLGQCNSTWVGTCR